MGVVVPDLGSVNTESISVGFTWSWVTGKYSIKGRGVGGDF